MKKMGRSLHQVKTGARGGTTRPGFTLVEALLAATILAIVAATATLPFAAGAQNSAEAQKLEQAVELGQAMMEEVLARPFFEPTQTTPSLGPDSGETSRTLYKSIDDFHGYSEASDKVVRSYKAEKVDDKAMTDYWRSVTVEYVTFSNMQPGDTNSLARVTVKVYRDTALLVTLSRLVSRED
ncbi:MAG TPA: type II secretion system protein [Phycisphaerae bacterium]|nr:type II secretion system protein [Phycisphaerae bacterium]